MFSPEEAILQVFAWLTSPPHTSITYQLKIARLKSNSYDLVLMDVQMPVMDGYSATRMIRQWEKEQGLKQIPIIALTANALKEDAQKSVEAGCTSHVTKPIKRVALMEAIYEYTRKGTE